MVREIVACAHLPWSRDKWWKLVKAVRDLGIKKKKWGISSLSEELPTSQGRNCPMELIHSPTVKPALVSR
jgi:hypothetical protein